MKKRNLCCLFLVAALATGLCGCGAKEQEKDTTGNTEVESSVNEKEENTTVGTQYLNAFKNSEQTEADPMVDELLNQVEVPYSLAKMEVSEGYLNGFDEEITGFQKGVMFSPVIGTIPFVGYVFETDDADALLSLLKEKANPAWNICTEADETVSTSKEKLVFFLMCTNENK